MMDHKFRSDAFSLIFDIYRASFKGIFFKCNTLGFRAYSYTNSLGTIQGILKNAVPDRYVVGFPLDINAQARSGFTVIADHAIFKKVSVTGTVFIWFLSEENTNFSIPFNKTVAHNIIGIPVSEIDPVFAIV